MHLFLAFVGCTHVLSSQRHHTSLWSSSRMAFTVRSDLHDACWACVGGFTYFNHSHAPKEIMMHISYFPNDRHTNQFTPSTELFESNIRFLAKSMNRVRSCCFYCTSKYSKAGYVFLTHTRGPAYGKVKVPNAAFCGSVPSS